MKDKIIIVTGGSGQLGAEIIKYLTSKGAVTINLDINQSTSEDLKQMEVDITNHEAVSLALESILEKYGKIDGLVNSAYPRTADWGNKFEDIKIDSWKENVDIQLNSCFFITWKVLEKMIVKNSGSIVNIASIYGMVGPNFSVYDNTEMTMPAAYSAIKGGIINFTRYLASYYGKQGIRINCISPGGIYLNQPKQFVENYCKIVPAGRMGNPEDIAPAVSFLLSDEASYITGQNLAIDGGWTAI